MWMFPKLLHLLDVVVPLAICRVDLNWYIGKRIIIIVLFGPMSERFSMNFNCLAAIAFLNVYKPWTVEEKFHLAWDNALEVCCCGT